MKFILQSNSDRLSSADNISSTWRTDRYAAFIFISFFFFFLTFRDSNGTENMNHVSFGERMIISYFPRILTFLQETEKHISEKGKYVFTLSESSLLGYPSDSSFDLNSNKMFLYSLELQKSCDCFYFIF